MGDNGWWPIILIAVLIDPRILFAGIATGLLARRWWQAFLGLVTAPAVYWLYCIIFLQNDHFAQLAPLLAIAGAAWAAGAFAVKKEWTA